MSSSQWSWDVEALSDEVSVPGVTILGKLGQGGMGEVYRGRDATGRQVAVKILRGMDAGSRDRFEREAELLARFKAPEIVGAHTWGSTQQLSYLVCELIEGQDLRSAAESLTLAARLDLFLEVTRAVGVAHRAGVVHRDLKPSNILIGEDGRARLIDFGLSIGLDQDRLTRTNQLVGTPAYLPPERLAASDPLPANDVWSLGAIGFELLTGALPYAANSYDELVRRFSPPPPMRAPVSRPVQAVIRRALDPDPAQRYPNADALSDALSEALVAPEGRRARRVAGAIAFLGTVVVVVGLVVAHRTGPPISRPSEVASTPTAQPSPPPTPAPTRPTPAPAPVVRPPWPLPAPASATLTKRERKRLGKIYDIDARRHLPFVLDLFQRGNPTAIRLIGLLRFVGIPELPQDRRLGHALLVRAVKHGCLAAGSDLALLYVSGIPLPRELELMTYHDHARALGLPANLRLAAALAVLGKSSRPRRGTTSSTKLLGFLMADHGITPPRSVADAYAIVQRELGS